MSATVASDLVVDASVAVKWFHRQGEAEVEEARILLRAHRRKAISACILDLTLYEVGNVGIRRIGWSAEHAVLIVRALQETMRVEVPSRADWQLGTTLATQHGLTLYEAAHLAIAHRRAATLVTLDEQLLGLRGTSRPSTVLKDAAI